MQPRPRGSSYDDAWAKVAGVPSPSKLRKWACHLIVSMQRVCTLEPACKINGRKVFSEVNF